MTARPLHLRPLLCTAIVLLCAVASSLPGAAADGERPAEHVVLISIDGLRPEFYLDPLWPAPRVQQMAREGIHARAVRGVFPTVTYPSHTTMITGALPARHGVHYNSPFEPGGATGRWYWEAASIRVPTLWDAARAAGLSTASLSWPVSVGAPIDYNVPEYWSLEPGGDPVAATRGVTRPPGLLEEIEREATGRLTRENFTLAHMTRDDKAGAAAAYLLERYRPALLTVHLVETDHFQHEVGREAPVVRRAVAAADRAVSQIVEAAERAGILERTAFVVTGDHGFIDLHTALAPNVWLVEAGLRDAAADRGDWRATFHDAAAAAFLHLRDPGDAATLARVRRLLEELPPAIRNRFRVLERDELERLGAAPEAALALAPEPGARFVVDAGGPAVRPATGGTHGYLPHWPEIHTGFLAWGAGVRSGAAVATLGLEDVAPFIAHLLALDFHAPDGLAPLGLLEE